MKTYIHIWGKHKFWPDLIYYLAKSLSFWDSIWENQCGVFTVAVLEGGSMVDVWEFVECTCSDEDVIKICGGFIFRSLKCSVSLSHSFCIAQGLILTELPMLWKAGGQNGLTKEWKTDRDSGISRTQQQVMLLPSFWNRYPAHHLSRNNPLMGQYFLKYIYTSPSQFLANELNICVFIYLAFFFNSLFRLKKKK